MSIRFGCFKIECRHGHVRRYEIRSIAVHECRVAGRERFGKNLTDGHRAGEELVATTQHSATQVFDGLAKLGTVLKKVDEQIGVPKNFLHTLLPESLPDARIHQYAEDVRRSLVILGFLSCLAADNSPWP